MEKRPKGRSFPVSLYLIMREIIIDKSMSESVNNYKGSMESSLKLLKIIPQDRKMHYILLQVNIWLAVSISRNCPECGQRML